MRANQRRGAWPLVVLLVTMLGGPADGAGGADSAKGRKLAAIFLLDRSPSARALLLEGKPAVDTVAQTLWDQVADVAGVADLELHLGAVNFGETLGQSLPLNDIPLKTAPQLPAMERISFTDFRPPLGFASTQLAKLPRLPGTKRLVVMVTDAEPWPRGARLRAKQVEAYFDGNDRQKSPSSKTLPVLLRGLVDQQTQILVLGLGDREPDAELWRQALPPGSYQSLPLNAGGLALGKRELLQRLLGNVVVPESGKGLTSDSERSDVGGDEAQVEGSSAPYQRPVIALAAVSGLLAALVLAYLVGGLKGQRTAKYTGRPETTNRQEVDKLVDRALTLARENRKVEATAACDAALEKSEVMARDAIPAVLLKILPELHPDDREQQTRYLCSQLQDGLSSSRARGAGMFIFRRWIKDIEFPEAEFFQFLKEPNALDFLKGLDEAWILGEDTAEEKKRGEDVKRLARSVERLRTTLTVMT